MKVYQFVYLFVYIYCASGSKNFAKDYYVSVNGSDDWDGTSPKNDPSSNVGPWKTIKHAINKIRQLRKFPQSIQDETTLNIMAGTYYQDATLNLNKRDSFLNIVTYKGDDVSISGGFLLDTSWTQSGNILQTQFAGKCPAEVFYGNYRLLPARSANTQWKPNMSIGKEPYNEITGLLVETNTCTRNSTKYSQTCPDENRNGFVLNNEISGDWKFLEQTEILIFHSWIAEYVKIDKIVVQDGKRKVMFQKPLKHAPVGTHVVPSGWRFLIFNNIALLDTPGEYVCVEDSGIAHLSYIPPNNYGSDFILSNIETIMRFNGVSNVKLKGLKFQHSSSGGKGKDSWNWGAQSAIRLISSSDIDIEDCLFSHTGVTGLNLQNANRILIQNNVFSDMGYHGIMMMFNKMKSGTMEDVMIRNNYFDGCGNSRYWQPGCLWIGGYKNISVINNEITNTAYMGVGVRGLMPHGDKYWSDNGIIEPTRDDYVFHIEFNHIHDFGNGILNDYGAVYIGTSKVVCYKAPLDQVQKFCYTYIHVYNNLIHDSRSFKDDAAGLYSDSGTCGNTFENNIFYGNSGKPLYHHCGLDNISKNNYIHRKMGRSPPDHFWGGCETSSSGPQRYSNFKNIYYLESAEGFTFSKPWYRFYNEKPNFHNNLYWSQQQGDKNLKLFPSNSWNEFLTFDEWTASGQDANSIWNDPLFLDPSVGNYLLDPQSPAWNLGIKQIQLDKFGLQTKPKYYCEIGF